MNPEFYIDFGTGFEKVPPPENWPDVRFEPLFTSTNPSASLQSINFKWEGLNARRIFKYRDDGLTGASSGVLEGLPLQIMMGAMIVFNGILDLPAASWECDIVASPIRQSGQIEWIKTFSEAFNFALLKDLGIITAADYKKTPYLITSLPDYPQLTMLILEEMVLGQQLFKEISDLSILLDDVAGMAITEVATSALTTADLVAAIANVVFEVAYIIILFAAILVVLQKILDQIIQTKKYKLCMRVEDLFKKGCQYMTQSGYPITFDSSIFKPGQPYYDLTIMPRKIIKPRIVQPIGSVGAFLNDFDRPADENGNPQSYGYSDAPSFRQFWEEVGMVFNARPYMYGGKFTFEEIHHYQIPSPYVMPNEGEQGYTYNYQDPHTLNIGELASNYLVDWSLDSTDENTIHQYRGTTCQVQITPINIRFKQNLLLPGLTQVDLPFALAKRKEYLNHAEQLLNDTFSFITSAINQVIYAINTCISAINSVLSWFSSGTAPSTPLIPSLPVVNVKIGRLELSGDIFSVQKMFIGQNVGGDWMVHPNNQDLMSADKIIQNFHGKNLLSRGNQWKLYKGKKFKMCAEDFFSILQYNLFTTADGKIGKFDKLVWNPKTSLAESVDFRIQENWTNNYQETITVDGGN